MALSDVAKIDFPLIEHGKVSQEHLTQALKALEIKKVHVVISDDIFHHHITDFKPDSGTTLEAHISKTVSEVFDQYKEPLHVVTLDLAKTSKLQTVQITATSKENLRIIKSSADAAGVHIESLIPASFVVKAFVSVDPSLFILQTPQSFLVTSHYIGVDYATRVEGSAIADVAAEVKKLKKEHPHLQHSYLALDATNNEEIITTIEEVLPTQAVEMKKVEAEADTPAFFKLIAVGFKEVTENDFPLPKLELDLVQTGETPAVVVPTQTPKVVEQEPEVKTEPELAIEKPEVPLQKPVMPVPTPEPAPSVEPVVVPTPSPVPAVAAPVVAAAATIATPTIVKAVEPVTTIPNIEKLEQQKTAAVIATPVIAPTPAIIPKPTTPIITIPVTSIKPPEKTINLQPAAPVESPLKKTGPLTTKKKSGMFSYILLAVGIAVVISLIGGGIVISQQALNEKGGLKNPIASATPPVSEVTPEPTPEPTATPEPVDKADISILVVNATKIAGKAGTIASNLKKAGFTTVDTGNAKDTYEDAGTFIMASDKENESVLTEIKTATKLSIDSIEFSQKEDASKKYDYVIVLNE